MGGISMSSPHGPHTLLTGTDAFWVMNVWLESVRTGVGVELHSARAPYTPRPCLPYPGLSHLSFCLRDEEMRQGGHLSHHCAKNVVEQNTSLRNYFNLERREKRLFSDLGVKGPCSLLHLHWPGHHFLELLWVFCRFIYSYFPSFSFENIF